MAAILKVDFENIFDVEIRIFSNLLSDRIGKSTIYYIFISGFPL